jgi:hypothetical protein
MNERIEKLAEQAGFVNFTVHNRIESKEQVLEKFADLIIMECAELSVGYGGNVKLLICNHFGLEP